LGLPVGLGQVLPRLVVHRSAAVMILLLPDYQREIIETSDDLYPRGICHAVEALLSRMTPG